jgi:hypothetical protein
MTLDTNKELHTIILHSLVFIILNVWSVIILSYWEVSLKNYENKQADLSQEISFTSRGKMHSKLLTPGLLHYSLQLHCLYSVKWNDVWSKTFMANQINKILLGYQLCQMVKTRLLAWGILLN